MRLHPVLDLIALVAIIALVVWAITSSSKKNGQRNNPNDPLEIAKTRLAKGEITKEQFENIKKDLR